jgi:hypothetical protein
MLVYIQALRKKNKHTSVPHTSKKEKEKEKQMTTEKSKQKNNH